jgi:hypothetical protein
VRIEFNPDWSEFLSALIGRRVEFLLIGAHAVAAHAEPRLTGDLDVLVKPDIDNARRLHAALIDFGFAGNLPEPDELAKPDKVIMLGRKPWRIDILTTIAGVSFDEAWAGRVETEFEAGPLWVIGRNELIKNKRAAGRDKDLLDLALLERHGPG